jgi:hypothetical protein
LHGRFELPQLVARRTVRPLNALQEQAAAELLDRLFELALFEQLEALIGFHPRQLEALAREVLAAPSPGSSAHAWRKW